MSLLQKTEKVFKVNVKDASLPEFGGQAQYLIDHIFPLKKTSQFWQNELKILSLHLNSKGNFSPFVLFIL